MVCSEAILNYGFQVFYKSMCLRDAKEVFGNADETVFLKNLKVFFFIKIYYGLYFLDRFDI